MIVGLLAMLFIIVSAYIVLARFDRQTLRLVGRAEQVTQILDSIDGVVSAAVRGPSDSPGANVTGAAYADTFGYKADDKAVGAPWLASPEPVRDPVLSSYPSAWPGDYCYPAVTGLSGEVAGNKSLTELMRDADEGGNGPDIRPGDPAGSLTLDTAANAREPFGDACGTGLPSSSFAGSAVLSELANAMTGRAVRASSILVSRLDRNAPWGSPDYENYLRWRYFDENARYVVSARVVSHGGMVQVSAPGQATWNLPFLGKMFAWVKHPNDSGYTLDPAGGDLSLYRAMAAASATVEPVLRRRGGLLVGSRELQQAGMPPALWELQKGRRRRTFHPEYEFQQPKLKNDSYQRFNLASLNEWTAWRQAVTIDPEYYNAGFPGYTDPARQSYVPRQVLTTVNNSDELARVQVPKDSTWTGLGIRPGQLKYYLGRISHAFDGDGHFQSDPSAVNYDGYEVIRDLAACFNEMLAGYGEWDAKPGEAVKQEEQAMMLAVNTVAFAAPHDVDGRVDAVYGADATKLYIGYAPQPFITQVVAYNENEEQGEPAEMALAVELYNPHDSQAPGGVGQHDLDLSRFAISINNAFDPLDPDTYVNLGELGTLAVSHLPGRTFLLFSVHDGSNAFFDNLQAVQGTISLGVPFDNGDPDMEVKLWRRGSDVSPIGWYLVDEMEIDLEDLSGQVQIVEDQKWHVNVQRDTSYEAYLGLWSGTGAEARWRMTVAFPKTDPNYRVTRGQNEPGQPVLEELGVGSAIPSDPLTSFGPCVAVHTMNAGLGPWSIHGVARPASFPTVGFMLLVPRFSHVQALDGSVRKPVTTILAEQWDHRGHTISEAPADFGHMPIFYNKQKENGSVGDFDKTGTVPWGLLVFDYFTTLNPNDANGDGTEDDPLDPYRVPGRININTAPWYLLAGLPLIGPDGPPATGELPINKTASPAFWSPVSGVLAGQGEDGTFRYPQWVDRTGAAYGQWYRLGPYLAQAAAAYRDRVQYVQYSASSSPFAYAHWRNAGEIYRPTQYGTGPAAIRGAGDDLSDPATAPTWKRGLLSVGELANVMGFDSWVLNDTAHPERMVDFFKAVSLLAMLDTQFLTTRSNTFTIYVTLTDRLNPQASVRSQVTVDRTNLLPRLLVDQLGNATVVQNNGLPELIGQREVSYFNARYDE